MQSTCSWDDPLKEVRDTEGERNPNNKHLMWWDNRREVERETVFVIGVNGLNGWIMPIITLTMLVFDNNVFDFFHFFLVLH